MTSLQKFTSYFCLIFIVICGAFALPADAAGKQASFAQFSSCEGSPACSNEAGALIPISFCSQWHELAEAPGFNEGLARFRRSAHYHHPKSNAPILFYARKVWQHVEPEQYSDHLSLSVYNPYYSRANSDYYSFLFRLTPF